MAVDATSADFKDLIFSPLAVFFVMKILVQVLLFKVRYTARDGTDDGSPCCQFLQNLVV